MWSYYIFCILIYLGYLFMYRSPNVYWNNCFSFLNVLAVFQQCSLKFMRSHRSLQELKKLKNSRSGCLNLVLMICLWKITNISRIGKGTKHLGQSSEVGKDGCQLILKVITLNKSQTKGSDPIFSHPAWAVDSTQHSR